MSYRSNIVSMVTMFAVASLFVSEQSVAQNSTNPYAIAEGWAKLPGGRVMGAVGKAKVDRDGDISGPLSAAMPGKICSAESALIQSWTPS